MFTDPLTFTVVIALLGLLIGSFLNVVIYRLPVMMERDWKAQCDELFGDAGAEPESPESPGSSDAAGNEPERFDLILPRSRCPHCQHAITALENIPVLSWLWLSGKCRECKSPISMRYPAIELLTGILSAVIAWHFGQTLETAALLAMTWTLIALAFIDIDHQLLPDNITLPLLWTGIAGALFGVTDVDLRSSVIGAMAGYLSLWSVFIVFKLLTGREGMGYGDFKLLAALGAWLGWTMLPAIILLSSFIGAVIGISMIALAGKTRRTAIPFGPYLAAAGWVALLWGHDLNAAYLAWIKPAGL